MADVQALAAAARAQRVGVNPPGCTRRALIRGTLALVATTAAVLPAAMLRAAVPRARTGHLPTPNDADHEILGQGRFRYRALRRWGELDPAQHPVRDCHGISMNGSDRVVLLTNDTHNNLLAYDRKGALLRAWEHRFPGAHGLDIVNERGEDRYWITDRARQLLCVCSADGQELLQVGPEALRPRYPDLSKYHPTNSAVLPDGDFFISDGYGSSYVHHFDPKGSYIESFGGHGDGPEHLDTPHSVWIDSRSGKPQLLVCDRGHNALKWFTPGGELLRIVDLGPVMQDEEMVGVMPANVASFRGALGGRFDDHLAIACIQGCVLIVDGADRVVSVIGGMAPAYVDGKLQPLVNYNYTFNHPHDVCIDRSAALYVSQWDSNRSYPLKLEWLS